MKTPKRVTQILGLTLLGVWGTVGYQIYSSVPPGEADGSENLTAQPAPPGTPFVYKIDVRDPFHMVSLHDTTKTHGLRRKPIPWTPPPLKVTGIIGERGRKLAVIEGPGGQVAFLGERDTLCGMKILKIKGNHVVYSYNRQKNEWVLDEGR